MLVAEKKTNKLKVKYSNPVPIIQNGIFYS